MKRFYYSFFFSIFFFIILYFGVGFYLAHTILKMDHSCGAHEGSLPNTWSSNVKYKDITEEKRIKIRRNFNSKKYHLDNWENVKFESRDKGILISGWLFNYFEDRPIIIIVHGLFPNGKCKSEPNLIAGLLIKNNINALTIDLRNYGQSTIVSKYENLGLSSYKDVLGAYDFLKTKGFKKNNIGLLGISLGASTVIFAAANETEIDVIWSESSLAKFNMTLRDEISRYGFPNIFGLGVRIAGQLLSGIDPTDLNPVYSLSDNKNYFFTHGKLDQRIYIKHFNYIKNFVKKNNINADFWLIENAGHVDSIFMNTEEYGIKMRDFFIKYLQ